MPRKSTIERAEQDRREGKAPARAQAARDSEKGEQKRRRTGREPLVRTTGAEETVKKASRTTKRSTLQRKGPRREVPPLMSGFGGYTP